MKNIEDLIEWYQAECMDGMTPPNDVLCKMFDLKDELDKHKYIMPEGIDTKEKHEQYLKDIGFKRKK